MSIALSSLLSEFCAFIGDTPVESVADSGDATELVDALLAIYGDGWFAEHYIYITSGDASGDDRRIQTFTKLTGTVEPYVDFSAAIGAGDTYQIKKTDTTQAIQAINDAIISLFTGYRLYRKIAFEDLGEDDLAANADAAQAEVEITDDTLFFVGQKVTISDSADSEDAEIESIATATNILTMTAVLTNAYTTARSAKVTAKSGQYFNLGATIGNARVTGVFIKLDETARRSQYPSCEVITNSSGVRQLYFPTSISVDDKTWVIEAIDKLEAVADPTDTITIDDRKVKLLYAEAAYHFYLRQSNDISAGDYQGLIALAARYRQQALTDFRALQMAKPVEVADMDSYD